MEPPRRRVRRPDGYISSSSTVSGHSCSTGRETSVSPVCQPHFDSARHAPERCSPSPSPPGMDAPSQRPPSPPPPPPPGHASRRPRLELLLLPRTAELNEAESALTSLVLVAMVGGNRPTVSPAQVRDQLQSFYNMPADAFIVSRHSPEDFLVQFNCRDDLECVLHALLGTAFIRNHRIDLSPLGLPRLDLSDQVQPFTADEVARIIKESPTDRAPGPDGLNGAFYKATWEIVGGDVVRTFQSLWDLDFRSFHLLNEAVMVLLHKTESPSGLKDYRPISLIHSNGKLFSKGLAMRLAPRMSELVCQQHIAIVFRRRRRRHRPRQHRSWAKTRCT